MLAYNNFGACVSEKIMCQKLKQLEPALTYQPLPGAIGEKIKTSISATAWQQWLAHQTMLINEYRLNVREPKAKEFLSSEMDKFLFGEGSDKPPGFTK